MRNLTEILPVTPSIDQLGCVTTVRYRVPEFCSKNVSCRLLRKLERRTRAVAFASGE